MNLNADVIHVGHVTDLLSFGQAAGIAQVRLNDADGMVLKELAVSPSGINSLACRHRNLDLTVDLPEQIGIQRLSRLFIIEAVELLKLTEVVASVRA